MATATKGVTALPREPGQPPVLSSASSAGVSANGTSIAADSEEMSLSQKTASLFPAA